MAQRAIGFAKRPVAAKKAHTSASTRTLAEAAARRVIPLQLASLLSPYKNRGRLSLRIERLPHLARLSRGRNNGNGSWSLASDELEELEYLLPEGMDEAHSLAIRIIDLAGGDGKTLAVLDYLVSPEAVGAEEAGGQERNAAVSSERKVETAQGQRRTPRRPEPDDSKFASLTAAIVERDGDAKCSPPEGFSKAERDESTFADLSAGL